MSKEGFNSATMIRAGTLRKAGFPIPEHIPDCAWTYREELNMDCTAWSEDADKGILTADVSLDCGSFHWVESKVTTLPTKVKCD